MYWHLSTTCGQGHTRANSVLTIVQHQGASVIEQIASMTQQVILVDSAGCGGYHALDMKHCQMNVSSREYMLIVQGCWVREGSIHNAGAGLFNYHITPVGQEYGLEWNNVDIPDPGFQNSFLESL